MVPSDCTRMIRGGAEGVSFCEMSVSADDRRPRLGGSLGEALRGDGGCRGGSSNVIGRPFEGGVCNFGESGVRSSSMASVSPPTLAGGEGGGGPTLDSGASSEGRRVDGGRLPVAYWIFCDSPSVTTVTECLTWSRTSSSPEPGIGVVTGVFEAAGCPGLDIER